MRRALAFILALALVFTGTVAFAATPFEDLGQLYTYYHYAAMVYSGEYEFGDNIPFWLLTGHNYGADVAAFRTNNGLFDCVFIPDATGEAVAEIQLLSDRATVTGNYDCYDLAYFHTLGMLLPFLVELAAADTAEYQEPLLHDIAYVCAQMGANYSCAPIPVGEVCTLQPFVQGQTFGVDIVFNEPVTREFILEWMWLTDEAFAE